MITAVREPLVTALRRRLRGQVAAEAPLAPLTSFKIGGPGMLLVTPADVEDLCAVLAFARAEGLSVHVLGGGSNTLVREGGIRGIVVRPAAFQTLARTGDRVSAGAGVRISRLLAFCVQQGLAGLEILSGVPGTVGGAIWGNAGAWGGAVGDRLVAVDLVLADGTVTSLPREAIPFGYRTSGLPRGAVVTAGAFALQPAEPAAIRARISGFLVRRNAGQPVAHRSAGSIFKNPPGDHAGRLVDGAGLKGVRIGGAMISEKHGNFILNLGGATATDVLRLAALMRRCVRGTAGVELELEVRVVGEACPAAPRSDAAPAVS